jgi:uncharacterized protein
VPLVYFDSSAFEKLVVEEPGSDLAADMWDGCDAALSSRLAYPEVCAALAASGRDQDLDEDGLAVAEQAWEEYWAVERHAVQLARLHSLWGADAVHLASALAIGEPELVFAVWDRRLHAGAQAAHLRVAPLGLNP